MVRNRSKPEHQRINKYDGEVDMHSDTQEMSAEGPVRQNFIKERYDTDTQSGSILGYLVYEICHLCMEVQMPAVSFCS